MRKTTVAPPPEVAEPTTMRLSLPGNVTYEFSESGIDGSWSQRRTSIMGTPKDLLAFALELQAAAIVELVKSG